MSNEDKLYYPRGKPARVWNPHERRQLAQLATKRSSRQTAKILKRSLPAVRTRASLDHVTWIHKDDVYSLNEATRQLGLSYEKFIAIAGRAGVELSGVKGSIRPVTKDQIRTIRKRLKDEQAGRKSFPKQGNPHKGSRISKPCCLCGCKVTRPKHRFRHGQLVFCEECWPKARTRYARAARGIFLSRMNARKFASGQPIQTRSSEGKLLLRERVKYVKAYVYLEEIQKLGVSISLIEVMRKIGIRPHHAGHPDKHIIFEAAEKLGMEPIEAKNTVMFK